VSVCDAEPTVSLHPLDELLDDVDGSVIGERLIKTTSSRARRQQQQATISSNRRAIKPRAMLDDINLDTCSKLDDISRINCS